jgi:glucose-1-phosphate adenylyltransferase
MMDAVGLVVSGGDTVLGDLDGVADAALTPFAGTYRFIDFALAAFANSGVSRVHVVSARPDPALRAHVTAAAAFMPALQRSFVGRVPSPGAPGRTAHVLSALFACREMLTGRPGDPIVVLAADHILQLDVRRLVDLHRRAGADVTLCVLSVPASEVAACSAVDVDVDRRVRAIGGARGATGVVSVWTGDLVVTAAALPVLAARLAAPPDAGPFGTIDLAAVDVFDGRPPGPPTPYWHDPASLEAYYDAQMQMCTPCPPVDLHDPAWPLRSVSAGYPPARVVADSAGRSALAVNALVGAGSVVRGAFVANAVLGRGVVIESGAEVEDAVLLDGCRIGRMARVRRAIVGAGAVVGDGDEIGFARTPASPATARDSGLTLVHGTAVRPQPAIAV